MERSAMVAGRAPVLSRAMGPRAPAIARRRLEGILRRVETPFLLFAIGVALVAIFAYIGWRQEQARKSALEQLAASLGFQFEHEDNDAHDEEYAQFEIFRRGHSRTAKYTMRGRVDLFGKACEVCAGDFRYKVTSGSGKDRRTTTYLFSYLIVHLPWPSPNLLVRREGFFDKVKGAFGFDDIDFESEEFSKRFWVQSNDKRFAYDVLHPRMMEFLLQKLDNAIDLEGGAICISDGSSRWEPSFFRSQLDFVGKFCERWPRHLLVDLAK